MDIYQFLEETELGQPPLNPQHVQSLVYHLIDSDYKKEILHCRFPNAGFEDYYVRLLLPFCQFTIRHFFLHALLNFGVHQLQRRAGRESFVAVGCFSTFDLVAAMSQSFYQVGKVIALADGPQARERIEQELGPPLAYSALEDFRRASYISATPSSIREKVGENGGGFIALLNLGCLQAYDTLLLKMKEVLSENGTMLLVDSDEVIAACLTLPAFAKYKRTLLKKQSDLSYLLIRHEELAYEREYY